MKLFKNEKYPCSEYLSKNGFYIPAGIDLNKEQMNYICDCINKVIV